MDHETFVNRLTGPLFVWRMGRGVAYPHGPQEEARTPLQRSGRTRMANAQRAMDDLVLARAKAIQAERRDARQCAAMSRGDHPVRCGAAVNHGPLKRVVVRDGKLVDKFWDHADRSQGTYWMEQR